MKDKTRHLIGRLSFNSYNYKISKHFIFNIFDLKL